MIDREARLHLIATALREARDHIDHLEALGDDPITVEAMRALHEAVGEMYEAVSDLTGGQGVEPWRPREPIPGE